MRIRTRSVVLIVVAVMLAGAGAYAFWPRAPRKIIARTEAERILLEAARAGELDIVRGLVEAGVSTEARDQKGYTPLILAAYHGHEPTVRALLELKADACAGDRHGNT